jgi:hypothetical protein
MRIQATDEQIRVALAELLEAQEAARRRFIDKDVMPAVAMAQAITAVKAFLSSVTPADTEFPVLGAATLAMADRARGINEPYLRRSEAGSPKRKSTTSLLFWADHHGQWRRGAWKRQCRRSCATSSTVRNRAASEHLGRAYRDHRRISK